MPASESYREIEPASELKPWLRCLWIYESDGEDRRLQRITPDGCPELIVHLGAPYAEAPRDRPEVLQPRLLFAGQLTRPLALRPTGPVRLAAARFEPDAAWAWLGRPMSQATDRRLDVSERLRPLSAFGKVLDPAQGAALLQAHIAQAVAGCSLDEQVRGAVRSIEAGEDLAPPDGADRRRLQRAFLRDVGIAPRTLRSVVRFRRVFTRFREPGGEEWLLSALRAGYFDQPQMARDFRRFLGCTATEWAAEQAGLAHRIASQSYKTSSGPQL